MRTVRMLAIVALFAAFAATPHIGAWVTTASASSGPMTANQESAYAPANDNESQDELCDSGNPRKQKKCHYNETDGDNDNDGTFDGPPAVAISVNNADPEEGDTITLTVHAWGDDIDQVWWWAPNTEDDNGNDNNDFMDVAHVFTCDGSDDCVQTSDLTPRQPGTFTIYAKARDRQGRESGEVATEVRVREE